MINMSKKESNPPPPCVPATPNTPLASNIGVGDNVLVTTDNWFFAPDGRQYRAVWGELVGVFTDDEVLGIKTNRGSTNWYVVVGNMTVAGCQVHYAIKCDEEPYHSHRADDYDAATGRYKSFTMDSRIYFAREVE